MEFERARTSEQIENRVNEIMRCAIEIYEKDGLEKLNFLEISKNTNFTRPAIYKYFKTKEEIMLSLVLHYMGKLTAVLSRSFMEDTEYSNEKIADIFTKAFLNSPEFMDLYAVLYTKIEKNVSLAALTKFKKDIALYQTPIHECLKYSTGCKSDEKIQEFMVVCLALATGLYPMCFVSLIQKTAIRNSATGYVSPLFEQAFKKALLLHIEQIFE